jgi:hypothetical protein
MKEPERIKILQWFTGFANQDLEQIEPGDRAKLLVESDRLWPIRELKEYGRHGPLPKELLADFSWALELPSKKSSEYWNAIVAAQKGIRELFASFLQVTSHRSPEVASAPSNSPTIIRRGHDEVLWWVGKGPGVPYMLTILPVTKSQQDYLQLRVLRLLEGFNQHAISRCPACKKWFFNPTDRDKRFCGNRCIWKTNTAKRRAADKRQKGKETHA